MRDLRAINYDDTKMPMWWIPISFTSKSEANMNNTKPQFWLKDSYYKSNIPEMPPHEEWYLVNMQQTGFFRVNYDLQNWKLLIHQLHEDHLVFDDMTRAQLLSDAFSLAYSGWSVLFIVQLVL